MNWQARSFRKENGTEKSRCGKRKWKISSHTPAKRKETLCLFSFLRSAFLRVHYLPFPLLHSPSLGKPSSHVLNSGWIRISPYCCSSCERRFVVAVGMKRPPWRLTRMTMSWKFPVLGWKPHPNFHCFLMESRSGDGERREKFNLTRTYFSLFSSKDWLQVEIISFLMPNLWNSA